MKRWIMIKFAVNLQRDGTNISFVQDLRIYLNIIDHFLPSI